MPLVFRALANLMNSDWGGYIGPSRCFCRCLLISCNLHWHMLDLAVNTMIRSEGWPAYFALFISEQCLTVVFSLETKTSLDEVIDFLGCLYPFEPPKMSDSPDLHNAFGPGLQIAGFGWSRLRSLNCKGFNFRPNCLRVITQWSELDVIKLKLHKPDNVMHLGDMTLGEDGWPSMLC